MNYITNSLYTLLTGEYIEGVTDLDRLINPAILKIFRKKTKGFRKKFRYPELTKEQKREIREFYRAYEKVDPLCHRVNTGRSGKFYPEYISEDMFYRRIEPFYTDRLTSKYLDNKCFYYRLFSNVRQPELRVMRIGGFWLDRDFRLISFEKAVSVVAEQERSVLKYAVFSECGHGVFFLEGTDRAETFRRLAKQATQDLVVQEEIRQHPAYAALHPASVNTYRIISMLTKDEGVKILASVIRIGGGDSRVDNLYNGGVLVGVGEGGRLGDIGVTNDGSVVSMHPDLHYRFVDIRLPHHEKALALVRRAHGIMGHNRIAHWDVAVDETGEAVLVETNLALGSIDCIQVCCGPLFGKDTQKVLNEVYYDRKGRERYRFGFRLPGLFGLIGKTGLPGMIYLPTMAGLAGRIGINERDRLRVRDNLLGILAAYYRQGYTNIVLLGNPALRRIDRKLIRESTEKYHYPRLTKEQTREVREYYRPYVRKANTASHRMYTAKSGKFCVDYIPEDMYMCDIDRYLSSRELSYDLDNKCLYYRLFPEAKQPEAVAMRIGGVWVDGDYQPITKREVALRVFAEPEVVIKGAQGSEGGADVHFLQMKQEDDCQTLADIVPEDDQSISKSKRAALRRENLSRLSEVIGTLKRDIVIQKPVRQHPDLARLHPESVNTYRIISLLVDDQVVILSRTLKIGAGNRRVDNGCSRGIYCGIDEKGRLKRFGALDDGATSQVHPSLGYRIEGIPVPCLDKCMDLVKRIHPFMGHHRLISWDVAVDSEGDAVLIEANLSLGGSDDVQVLNGPFFGKYTRRILDEVYRSERGNK